MAVPTMRIIVMGMIMFAMPVRAMRMREVSVAKGHAQHHQADQQDRAIACQPQPEIFLYRRGQHVDECGMNEANDDDGADDMAEANPPRHSHAKPDAAAAP